MDQFAISLSLLALTACLTHGGWLAICLATGRLQIAASSLPTALLLCGSLLVGFGVNWVASESFPNVTFNQTVLLIGVVAWLALRFGWSSLPRRNSNVARWRAFAAAHVVLLAVAAWNFRSSTWEKPFKFGDSCIPSKVLLDDAVVVTDRGRIFTPFRYETGGHSYEDHASEEYKSKIVRVASPDLTSNCHGWVFANGRYALPEAVVAALLQDNSYSPVQAPQSGDVIVYRDEEGKILHSGRVHRVHDNGLVWIESKWGPGARYRHLPQDQCYSQRFDYYRTSRPTHEAQVVRTPTKGDSLMAKSEKVPLRRARG